MRLHVVPQGIHLNSQWR
uniref:Uncharacterized protein n=1 Tax=Arundo donax TaxID=35708 RepID=A0A0A9B2P5_ARUDO